MQNCIVKSGKHLHEKLFAMLIMFRDTAATQHEGISSIADVEIFGLSLYAVNAFYWKQAEVTKGSILRKQFLLFYWKLLNFLKQSTALGSATQHISLNVPKIQQKASKNVMTLNSLCISCYLQDTCDAKKTQMSR